MQNIGDNIMKNLRLKFFIRLFVVFTVGGFTLAVLFHKLGLGKNNLENVLI